jgi:hypothetical protein
MRTRRRAKVDSEARAWNASILGSFGRGDINFEPVPTDRDVVQSRTILAGAHCDRGKQSRDHARFAERCQCGHGGVQSTAEGWPGARNGWAPIKPPPT